MMNRFQVVAPSVAQPEKLVVISRHATRAAAERALRDLVQRLAYSVDRFLTVGTEHVADAAGMWRWSHLGCCLLWRFCSNRRTRSLPTHTVQETYTVCKSQLV